MYQIILVTESIACSCGPGGKKVNKCPPSLKNGMMLLGQPLFLILAAFHFVLMEDAQLSWSFMQLLIYFLVNALRKQSLELDGNWLCFIKVGKEEISLLGNLLHSWRRKKMSNWDKGGFVTPTSLLPAGKIDMKGLRIGQSFIFFWWKPVEFLKWNQVVSWLVY